LMPADTALCVNGTASTTRLQRQGSRPPWTSSLPAACPWRVSLPTMLVAFARYSRDGSFAVLRANARFLAVMAAGSVAGAVLGGLLLGVVPSAVLIPLLVALLLASAAKVWRHQ